MVLRERLSVVKMIGFRVIFPETGTVFCETDMVGGAGRGNPGVGRGRITGGLQSIPEGRQPVLVPEVRWKNHAREK